MVNTVVKVLLLWGAVKVAKYYTDQLKKADPFLSALFGVIGLFIFATSVAILVRPFFQGNSCRRRLSPTSVDESILTSLCPRSKRGSREELAHLFVRSQDYFRTQISSYTSAELQISEEVRNTPCGSEDLSGGPFYCPADGTIYMPRRFIDGTMGYLMAHALLHEAGHHAQRQQGPVFHGVRYELGADCHAGALGAVLLRPEELAELESCALDAGSPLTHGSGEQRRDAIRKGARGGLEACGGAGGPLALGSLRSLWDPVF